MEHYLIVKFRKDTDVKIVYEEIKGLFEKASEIEGVKKADVFLSSGKLRNNYDMMIKVQMKKSTLQSFKDSDLYREWEEKYSKYISKTTVFDS